MINCSFDFTKNLQYKVKSLEKQVAAFRSGEKYIKMQAEFEKRLSAKELNIKRLTRDLSNAHAKMVTIRKNWSEIFDDLDKEHTKELLEKDRKIKAMEERTLCAERQRDEALDKVTFTRKELYEALTALEKEKGRTLKLRAQVNRDYANSSIPSSQKPLHNKIQNSREKSGKLPGGQPGHEGHKRKKLVSDKEPVFVAAPEEVLSNPDFYLTGKTIYKQVIDLKVVATATDYYALEYRKRSTGAKYHAPFPSGICNEVNYGCGLKALAFLLNNYCNVSIEKTQGFISDATDGAVNLSTGMINKLGRTFSVKTEKERMKIFNALLMSPVMYTDATVSRVNGKGKSVVVCTSGNEVLYFLRDHKGHEGVKGTPVEDYQHSLVHDHDRTYYSYGSNHQECLAHILRYLKDSIANEPSRTWNKEMHAFLQKMIHEVKAANRQVSEMESLNYEKEYDRILKIAQDEYQYEPPSRYYKEGFNLQKRLKEYRDNHLFFLRHPEVGYTNNVSERYLRKYKRKQKQAVTFRSQNDAECLCNALGVIETGRLNGKSAFQTIKSVFES